MGPDDFIDMLRGHNWRQERENDRQVTQMSLLRMLATDLFNFTHKKRNHLRYRDVLYIPEIDDIKNKNSNESRAEQKQRLDDFLEKANKK